MATFEEPTRDMRLAGLPSPALRGDAHRYPYGTAEDHRKPLGSRSTGVTVLGTILLTQLLWFGMIAYLCMRLLG